MFSLVKRISIALGIGMLLAFPATTILAHESVEVGDLEVEIGWLTEPAVVGEKNAIFIAISKVEDGEHEDEDHEDTADEGDEHSHDDDGEEGFDVGDLTVAVATGGQSREFDLRNVEGSSSTFIAEIVPTARGTYTISLSGAIGDEEVDVSVEIEEVEAASELQFPINLPSAVELSRQIDSLSADSVDTQSDADTNRGLAIAGLAVGGIGLVVGVVGLTRKRGE